MFKKFMHALTGLAVVFGMAAPAMAQLTDVNPSNLPSRWNDLGSAISTIFGFVILLAGIIFVILFLVGGITYLTSAGNEENTGKAKKQIVDAIVGLVIVLAAWAVGNFVLRQLGWTNTTQGNTSGTIQQQGGTGGSGNL